MAPDGGKSSTEVTFPEYVNLTANISYHTRYERFPQWKLENTNKNMEENRKRFKR